MDSERFDTLTRTLSSRRTALSRLAATVATVLGLTPSAGIAHNPLPACRQIKDARKRAACRKRARTHNRKHNCKPKPPATFCGGHCGGTAVNNCGKRVACTCPAGKSCLGNGSCAQSCPILFGPGCPTGCECAPDVETALICFAGSLPSCEHIPQVCTTSATCPPGYRCALTDCNGEQRCYPLCPG